MLYPSGKERPSVPEETAKPDAAVDAAIREMPGEYEIKLFMIANQAEVKERIQVAE